MFTYNLLEIRPNSTVHLFEPIKAYYDFSHTNNPGWNTYVHALAQIDTMERMSTQLRTLSSYCEDHKIDHIDFIKIDTEGYEAYVLDGFLDTLQKLKKKPIMYIEVGWGDKHPNWEYAKQVFNQLYEIGYKTDEDFSSLTSTADILFYI